MIYLTAAAAIIILLAILLKRPYFIKVRPTGTMLGYKLIYTDKKHEKKSDGVLYSKLLQSNRYNIRGKPDYIYKKIIGGGLMPIELKSGKIGDAKAPHEGDLLQLAAYFLIIEEEYQTKPKEGRLVYSDYMFKVKNTKRLRSRLLGTIYDMRNMLEGGEQEANPSYVHCRYCLCRGTVCEIEEKK